MLVSYPMPLGMWKLLRTEQLWSCLPFNVTIKESLKMPKRSQNTAEVTEESLKGSLCCVHDMWQPNSHTGVIFKIFNNQFYSGTEFRTVAECPTGPESWRPPLCHESPLSLLHCWEGEGQPGGRYTESGCWGQYRYAFLFQSLGQLCELATCWPWAYRNLSSHCTGISDIPYSLRGRKPQSINMLLWQTQREKSV